MPTPTDGDSYEISGGPRACAPQDALGGLRSLRSPHRPLEQTTPRLTRVPPYAGSARDVHHHEEELSLLPRRSS